MLSLTAKISRWFLAVRKTAGAVIDVFRPSGYCEAILFYAHGPKKGQVYKRFKGRNVVTSWLSIGGVAPTAGRDMMRRILIPTSFAAETLANDDDAVISQMLLGSGTTAEASSDTQLANKIDTSMKTITSVVLDGSNPYVTFIAEWDESEVNQPISEAALYSSRGVFVPPAQPTHDFIARKTFGTFTKTNEFTLQIRWQIRF